MEYINPLLLLILIAEICLGICAWQSPRSLRRIAAQLLTRADVMDLSRQERERRLKLWLDELGVAPNPRSPDTGDLIPARPFSNKEVKAIS